MIRSRDGPYYICEACRERVERGAPGIVEAAELIRADTFGGTDYLEGLHVFFHESHIRSARPRSGVSLRKGRRAVARETRDMRCRGCQETKLISVAVNYDGQGRELAVVPSLCDDCAREEIRAKGEARDADRDN